MHFCKCLEVLPIRVSNPISGEVGAAAPDSGRDSRPQPHRRFKPHQRGGGCCSSVGRLCLTSSTALVSNPISGEVGAAAQSHKFALGILAGFQTPSAGRWVLQH